MTLRIAGREDFIAMQCFAGSPQDLLDARSAYQAAPGPIDPDLLRTRTVARRFGRGGGRFRVFQVAFDQPGCAAAQRPFCVRPP